MASLERIQRYMRDKGHDVTEDVIEKLVKRRAFLEKHGLPEENWPRRVNLSERSIKTVPLYVFMTASTLIALDLRRNDIADLIPGVFEGLSSLRTLHLDYNKLGALTVGVFGGLSSLISLGLSGNALEALPVGVFGGLSSLTVLGLGGNALESLTAGVFGGLSRLTTLGLGDNALETLPTGVFGGLSSLTLLYLGGNKLKTLTVGVFGGLSNLTKLGLGDNALETLPTSVFGGLSSLTELYLGGNKLKTLPVGVFGGLSRLTYLYLNSNALDVFAAGVFGGLSSLTTLDLRNNPISRIQQITNKEIGLLSISSTTVVRPAVLKNVIRQTRKKLLRTRAKRLPVLGAEEAPRTEWQTICAVIGETFRLDELRAIARQVGIDPQGMSKRALCAALAESYEKGTTVVAERNCANDSILGYEYDTVSDDELVTYEEGGKKWCFAPDEIEKLEKNPTTGKIDNPYTRQPIPEEVLAEAEWKRALPRPAAAGVHELRVHEYSPAAVVKRKVKTILDKMDVPRDKLETMTPETLTRLTAALALTFPQINVREAKAARARGEGLPYVLQKVPEDRYSTAALVIQEFFARESEEVEEVEESEEEGESEEVEEVEESEN